MARPKKNITTKGPVTFSEPGASGMYQGGPGDIVLCSLGIERIRVTPDGFYVEGKKVNDDPAFLYDAMVAFFKNLPDVKTDGDIVLP